MSKHRVAVLTVVSSQSFVTAAAAEYGISRRHLQRLLRRHREGGLEALEPRSRWPLTNPGRTPEVVRDRIVALRTELTAGGFEAGSATIAWHLGREGQPVPSTSTIRRILCVATSVTHVISRSLRPRPSAGVSSLVAPVPPVRLDQVGREYLAGVEGDDRDLLLVDHGQDTPAGVDRADLRSPDPGSSDPH